MTGIGTETSTYGALEHPVKASWVLSFKIWQHENEFLFTNKRSS